MALSSKASSLAADRVQQLHGELLKTRLKRKIKANYESIMSAFRLLDKNQTNFIHFCELRNILETFCLPLTDRQWGEVISEFRCVGDNIKYTLFIDVYMSPEESTKCWLRNLGHSISHKPNYNMAPKYDEFIDHIKEACSAKRNIILQDFVKTDVCGCGSVCYDEFLNIMNKFIFRATTDFFEKLWCELPKDSSGKMRYVEFLRDYSCCYPELCPDPKPMPPDSMVAQMGSINLYPRYAMPKSYAQCTQEAVLGCPNAEAIHLVLKDLIKWKFRNIIKSCITLDLKNKGSLPGEVIRGILIKVGIPIDKDPMMDYLAVHYGLCTGSAIDYWDFLKQFVCLRRFGKNAACTAQHKFLQIRKFDKVKNNPHIPLYGTLLRIRPKVIAQFASILSDFKKMDPTRAGIVPAAKFQEILSLNRVRIRYDENYHLLEYLDPWLSGSIPYQRFMRLFTNDIND